MHRPPDDPLRPDDGPVQPPPPRLATVLGHRAFVGGYAAVFLAFAALRLVTLAAGGDLTAPEVAWLAVADAALWALVALVAYAGAWGLMALRLSRGVRAVLAAALVLALVAAFSAAFRPVVAWVLGPDQLMPLSYELAGLGVSRLIGVSAYVGTGFAMAYFARWRADELAAARLEARVAESRTEALAMQVQPDFLFATFRAIQGAMYTDARAANRMLARLSDLLRLTLAHAGAREVPLGDELEALALLVEIEQARLGPRLDVAVRVDDDLPRDAAVPRLLLPPLVENAVRHGVEARPGAGRVRVSLRREGERLLAVVEDDGPGFPADAPEGGPGLAGLRERLAALHGAGASLRTEPVAGGGARVVVTLPLARTAA